MAAEHVTYIQTNMPAFAETYMQPRFREDAVDLALSRYSDCFAWAPQFANANVPFLHAIMIYALTFTPPYRSEVRQTPQGWVNPHTWIINNYGRFRDTLESYDEGGGPTDPGGGSFSPFVVISFVATSNGVQQVSFPVVPSYYELSINGLGQNKASCVLVGVNLTIPGTYQIESGDEVEVKYLTPPE